MMRVSMANPTSKPTASSPPEPAREPLPRVIGVRAQASGHDLRQIRRPECGACERGRLPPLCGEDIADLFGFEVVEVDLDVLSERDHEVRRVSDIVDSVPRIGLHCAVHWSCQAVGANDDPRLLAQVAHRSLGQRLTGVHGAADARPIQLARSCRILLLEQQDGAGRADREHARRYSVDRHQSAPSGFARWPAVEMRASLGPSIRRPGRCRSELETPDKDQMQAIVAAQGERLQDLRLVSEELGRCPTTGAAFTTPGPPGKRSCVSPSSFLAPRPQRSRAAPHPNPRTL